MSIGATASPVVQSETSAFQKPTHPHQQTSDVTEYNVPFRPAGRVVSWKGESFASKLMAQDRKKALAKDLKGEYNDDGDDGGSGLTA